MNTDHVIQSYLAGKPMKELASELGISVYFIKKTLLSRGIRLRPKSEISSTNKQLWWDRATPEKLARFSENASIGHKRQSAALPPEVRRERAAKAQAARRGMKDSLTTQQARAATRQRKLLFVGEGEESLQFALGSLGIDAQPQQAVGPYSVDLALKELPIAVEIENGWKLYQRRGLFCERLKYLLDGGWAVLYVVGNGKPLVVANVAQKVIALLDLARWYKPVFGQYGMITRNGDMMAGEGSNLEGFTRVPGF
jgi:hypothetical protein